MDKEDLRALLQKAQRFHKELRVRFTPDAIDAFKYLVAMEHRKSIAFPTGSAGISKTQYDRKWTAFPERIVLISIGPGFDEAAQASFVGRLFRYIEHAELNSA